jgi:hypothetical protein
MTWSPSGDGERKGWIGMVEDGGEEPCDDGGQVGPAAGVDRRQPEGVVAGSAGARFLGQVGLEGPAHVRPVEWGEVVEVGEVLLSGFGSSHVSTDDGRRPYSSVDCRDVKSGKPRKSKR